MSILFNEYLTGDDREVAIMEAEVDSQLAKLNLLLETVQSTLKVNMMDAEAKVFAENGTYDDLTTLYAEAGEEAKQKSGGIFAAIFGAIGRFFARIGNFFRERFGKKAEADIPDTVQVDQNLEQDMSKFQKCWNTMKSGIADLKNGNISGSAKKIFAIAIPTFTVLAGGAVTYVAISKAKLKQHTDTLEEAQQQIEAASNTAQNLLSTGKAIVQFTGIVKADDKSVEKANNNTGDGANNEKSWIQKAADKLKEFGSKILAFLKKIWAWISGANKETEAEAEAPVTNKKVFKVAGRLKGKAKNAELEAPAEEEKEYFKGEVNLSKEEEKQAKADAKKASGKKRLNKEEKAKAVEDAKAAKKKASNDRIASVVDKWDEDEYGFSESTELTDTEMNELDELFANL